MPLKRQYGPAAPIARKPDEILPPEPQASDAPGIGGALAGAAALGGAALLARNPALAKSALGKLGQAYSGARYAAMLSGLAVPKSVLGNVGAAATGAIERRSLAPLREFFSPRTVKEFVSELRQPGQAFGERTGRLNPFGTRRPVNFKLSMANF